MTANFTIGTVAFANDGRPATRTSVRDALVLPERHSGTASEMSKVEQEAMFAGAVQTIPLRRIGSAEDIAQAMLFAATNPYVTGEIFDISGGLQLGTFPPSVSYGNQ